MSRLIRRFRGHQAVYSEGLLGLLLGLILWVDPHVTFEVRFRGSLGKVQVRLRGHRAVYSEGLLGLPLPFILWGGARMLRFR